MIQSSIIIVLLTPTIFLVATAQEETNEGNTRHYWASEAFRDLARKNFETLKELGSLQGLATLPLQLLKIVNRYVDCESRDKKQTHFCRTICSTDTSKVLVTVP